MKQYKPVFKRTLDLLEKYYTTVDKDCLSDIQTEASTATTEFERDMLAAAAEELNRIYEAKKEISGTFLIDFKSYNPAFIKAFFLLEKYYLTITDDKWPEVVDDLSGDVTKLECSMSVAVVLEIERIYKANFADEQQPDQPEQRHSA